MSLSQKYKGSYASYIITFFFFYFCMAIFSSILSVYLTKIGKSAQEMSFIISSSSLFSVFMAPLVGWLSDRTQRPKLISAIFILIGGVCGLAFAATTSVWLLFLLNGLVMSSINSVQPVTERMASASLFRYGSIRVWGTIGFATASQTAGFVLEKLDSVWMFILLFLSSLITLIGLVGTPGFVEREQEKPEKTEKTKRSFAFLKNPNYLLFLLCMFLCYGASGANMTYSPVLLSQAGVSDSLLGTVLFFSTLVEIPLIFFSHKFMDRYSGKNLFILCFCLFILQFTLYGFLREAFALMTVVILIKAIASTLLMMLILKIVRNIVDTAVTSTAMSVVSSGNALASILFLNIGGAVIDAIGLHTFYLILAGVCIVGLFLCLFLKVDNSKTVFGKEG